MLRKSLVVLLFAATQLVAQNTGAISNGNWNDPTIWTVGTVPGASNNVYIGSTTPPAPLPSPGASFPWKCNRLSCSVCQDVCDIVAGPARRTGGFAE